VPVINVNLIAERERAQRTGEAGGRLAFFLAVVTFVATMVTFTWQQTKLRALRSNIASTQVTVSRLESQKNEVDGVQRQLDNKRPLVDLLRSARESEAKWCEALASIDQARPDGVGLTSVRSSKSLRPRITEVGGKGGQPKEREGFTLVGQAKTNNLVAQYITNLQNTTSFTTKEVSLSFSRRRSSAKGEETIDFEVVALLPGKGAPQ
jgi:Tfp pilus assembly protein PilN